MPGTTSTALPSFSHDQHLKTDGAKRKRGKQGRTFWGKCWMSSPTENMYVCNIWGSQYFLTPHKCHDSFIQNCHLLTLRVSHHQRWKICVKSGTQNQFVEASQIDRLRTPHITTAFATAQKCNLLRNSRNRIPIYTREELASNAWYKTGETFSFLCSRP